MFLLKKIIAAFIMPSGAFVLLLAGGAFYFRKRCRQAAWFCLGVAALLWAGSAKVVADLLLGPLEYAYTAPVSPAGDVIIVLGGGSYDPGPVFSAGERLHSSSLERNGAAALLHKKTKLPIIATGGAVFSRDPEAEAFAAYLEEQGVPARAIIKETRARDTAENALYSYKLCVERGFKKPILLTSASHMPRAVYLFKRAGFAELTPFPVSRTVLKGRKRYLRDFLPGTFHSANEALNEYLGLFFYKLF
jgi:uncharacterized SAM-binding protein YcdF (DUF218 family)